MNHALSQKRGVLLWDVDGTLVTSRKRRLSVHGEIVREYFGVASRAVLETTGLTDYELLRELSPSHATQTDIGVLLDLLDDRYVKSFQDGGLAVLPGVLTSLRLADDLGWQNALQTGNTARRSKIKLHSVKLWECFSNELSSFGDLPGDRTDLVARARERVIHLLGASTPLLIIGDTPRDAAAACQHGIPMLAVETGEFGGQVLRQSGATYVVSDLEGGAQVFATVLKQLRDGLPRRSVGPTPSLPLMGWDKASVYRNRPPSNA